MRLTGKINIKIKTVMFLVITGFLVGTVFSQENLNLQNAIKKGLKNNFQIRISAQELKIAENNNSWGTAGRYPVINLGVNQNNIFSDSPTMTDPDIRQESTTNFVTPYVSLNWTLFNGFSIKITKDKLGMLNKLSEGNAAIVVENTIQGILLGYYKVLLEQEKLKVIQEVMKLSKDRYDYVLARKEIGIDVTYDVLQAKIAYLGDKSNFLLQQLNFQNALRNLNLTMGEPVEKEYRLVDEFKVIEEKYDLAQLIGKMENSNKTLKNQYINQAILKKEVSLQKSALYPQLSLNSGISMTNSRIKYQGLPAATSDSYDYYANFSLSFNLFNGGNTSRAISNAKIQEKIGNLRIEEMKQSLRNLLKTTYEFYNVRKEIYRVADESVKSAALNMKISGEKYKSGAINSFNYRDVQLLYQSTANNKLESIYNLMETLSELMILTGGIITEY